MQTFVKLESIKADCHSLSRILGKLHALGSTASAYLDGAESRDLLPADGDGPDVPQTTGTQGQAGSAS